MRKENLSIWRYWWAVGGAVGAGVVPQVNSIGRVVRGGSEIANK